MMAPPPTSPSPRAIGLLLCAIAPILLVVYLFIDPVGGSGRFLPKCVLHEATGISCPGCGGQRALHSLLKGDLLAAFRYNPLAILLSPLLLYYGLPILYFMIVRNEYRELWMPSWLVVALAVVIVAYFILRNLPWMPFRLLAPG